ncbi:translocation/assembly module TamB domain-containing protein [Paraurantiacibacter namhicola]|uniref:Translocation and assembly module TamB C-terminal domain-containing protein n=1 Tax=Paraurantiacibacter namhicola TaxID=645517 RepID=A0A1C7DAY1_9SPHN|nr:translocation/assembly module TamB domain-containing protein [Paraurantiacibacter namhicola]ANU08577.1 hypothetical protein A6F65_02294 [Paraurantiacibacter namhicola]
MAGEGTQDSAAEPVDVAETGTDDTAPRKRKRRWFKRGALGIFGLLIALVLGAVVFLNTQSGRDFIVDQIAGVAPASGLSVEVGRIEGSVLSEATFYDVRLRDANDTLFLVLPEVRLDWRPLKFFFSGLDIRDLDVNGGTLLAIPELNPGDPDAPVLPNFDIRVDRLSIQNLRVADGVIGEERIIALTAQADIRQGRVQLDADGEFGGEDRFAVLLDAEPDANMFDIDLDYRAPAGGFLAAMAGAEQDLLVRIVGDGTWQDWDGALVVLGDSEPLLATKIGAKSGRYRIVGQARPGDYVTGLPQRALGEVVDIAAVGTLDDSILTGDLALRGAGVWANAEGGIDLGNNEFDNLDVDLDLRDPALFGPDFRLEGTDLELVLDGPFRGVDLPHRLTVDRAMLSGTEVIDIEQSGIATWDGTRFVLPLDASVQRVISGNELADPRLVNGTLGGTVVYTGGQLLSDDLAVRFPGLTADLALRGDLDRGAYALAGPVAMQGLALENIGTVDGNARIRFSLGANSPWKLDADFDGRMARVTNDTLANLAGSNIRFDGGVTLGADRPIVFRQTQLRASKLSLTLDGRVSDGRTTLAGRGRHVDYGPFTVEAALSDSGPTAQLVFADPLPAAGLKDVRVALAPTREGFAIDTSGQSLLGPFDGALNLYSPANGPTRIEISRMDISGTDVAGSLVLADGGVAGDLALSGGGLDGTVTLAPRSGGQGFDANLRARNARFQGPTPLAIASADVDLTGVVGGDGTTMRGTVSAQGISYGQLFVGRLQGNARVTDGVGSFEAALTGRRGARFALQVQGQANTQRIAVVVDGTYAGRDITMPRRAVLLKQEDGGWALQKTQLGFAGGFVIAEGQFGGTGGTSGTVKLADMPLSLVDVLGMDLGLGGDISGVIDFDTGRGGLPTGEARVLVDGLTRSGLVLTSRPVDLAFVGKLTPNNLQMRATFKDGAETSGRLQGRIANLPASGGLMDRLNAGDMYAQLRYKGPAEALWRLAALDLIDITGQLNVAANITGSLADPGIRGSLAGDNLQMQSALTGTNLSNVRARGRFAGSRLELSSFKGTAPNGGAVSGSGVVDLSNLGAGRGPMIDLRMAARNAEIMDLPNMGATVTGPMRIKSNGVGGVIAGRLEVDGARWKLGTASSAASLPNIKVTQVNRPNDYGPAPSASAPWRYLIDARSRGGILVDGMGLDSEWSADILLRGTTSDPRIGGEARVVPRQGFYNFAGNRFDITRGVIDFDENQPIDPRVSIVAQTELRDGLDVTVTVRGNATNPEVDFSSNPGLPQEEILARLLFGGSITDLSATDALQLGSALASLRGGGGGGLDPINSLRTAIGLDRLRIVAADPALDRGTAIALGKRFGNRFYGEIITDGRGYNATELEFRITSWLAMLASVSSLGRDGVALEYSKDY